MIQANELRIGNLLRDKVSKTELKVIELTEKGIVTYVIDRSKFPLKSDWGLEPIQLTEEILLKCGFVQCENEFWYQKNIISISPSVGTYEIQGSKLSLSVMRENPIRYLHQLQNLYFALTNEELTFNNL